MNKNFYKKHKRLPVKNEIRQLTGKAESTLAAIINKEKIVEQIRKTDPDLIPETFSVKYNEVLRSDEEIFSELLNIRDELGYMPTQRWLLSNDRDYRWIYNRISKENIHDIELKMREMFPHRFDDLLVHSLISPSRI
jgi:tRNA splicing ligase